MKALLRVTPRPEVRERSFIDRILRRRPEIIVPHEDEKSYTPTVIDLSRIDFAFIDDEGDINIRYMGDGDYYALQYSDILMNAINRAVDEKNPRIRGFVDK